MAARPQLDRQGGPDDGGDPGADAARERGLGGDFLQHICGSRVRRRTSFPFRPSLSSSSATVANHRDTCACTSQDELKQELAELEQEELDEKLMADHAPVHHPAGPSRVEDSACPYCVPLTSRMLIAATCRSSRATSGRGRRGGAAQGATSSTGYVVATGVPAHHPPRTFLPASISTIHHPPLWLPPASCSLSLIICVSTLSPRLS